jgi:pyruvate/2-oxoglutarate dehydrogenase complex dihydrolipoamide dehydrogenase (E3) component
LTDYANIPTTVFTPLEYGSCGLSEEKAADRFDSENIEVFHTNFCPLEWTVAGRPKNACYMKLIVTKNERKVIFVLHL